MAVRAGRQAATMGFTGKIRALRCAPESANEGRFATLGGRVRKGREHDAAAREGRNS